MLFILAIPLLALLFAGHAHAQSVNFMNITAPYQNFTTTCISILNQAVACDAKITLAGREGAFESDATLRSVCTASCTNALTLWSRRVAQVCSTSRYSTDGKTSVLATFLAQGIVESYAALCVQDKQGKFCHAVVRDAFMSAGSETATTMAPSVACNTCVASILSTQAQMPIGYGQTQIRAQYSSLTSSCKLSSMALTSLATTTAWATTLPAAPTPSTSSCVGQRYTVRTGDNCRTVSFARGISTISLLTANSLRAHCANFPPAGGTLCIPTASVCKPYQLKADLSDTCHSIARAAGITWTQLISWNPELGEYCEALSALAAGAGPVICVSQPGGGWTNPSPDPSSSSSTPTTYSETYFTLTPTPFAPKATLPPTATTTSSLLFPMAGYVEPFANGSVLDCHLHRPPPVRVNGSLTDSYLCADYALFYGITLAQLIEWNPSLLEQTGAAGGGADCYLWPGEKYCAQRDNSTGLAPGMTNACVDLRIAESGARGTCEGFLGWYGLGDAKGREAFGEWNPSVGGECKGFKAGGTYCVAVRGFRAKGTIATCSRWHLLQSEDLASGCGGVEGKYGVTHGRFVAWNPVLGSDCKFYGPPPLFFCLPLCELGFVLTLCFS